ncbi:hypothetical protein MHU86_12942 [Fragilaria crotonensis]|nr:hypothetical protein MHU86_12942 [Fragilaria crotonensis]
MDDNDDDDVSSLSNVSSGVASAIPAKGIDLNRYLIERFNPDTQPHESRTEQNSEKETRFLCFNHQSLARAGVEAQELVHEMQQWCQQEEQEMINFERLAVFYQWQRSMHIDFMPILCQDESNLREIPQEQENALTMKRSLKRQRDYMLMLRRSSQSQREKCGAFAEYSDLGKELVVAQMGQAEAQRKFSEAGSRLVLDDLRSAQHAYRTAGFNGCTCCRSGRSYGYNEHVSSHNLHSSNKYKAIPFHAVTYAAY